MEMMMTDPFSTQRIFDVEKSVRFSEEKAVVTEIAITQHSSIAVWGVRPGQQVPAHTHPDGQDTWIVVRGELTYYLGNGHKKIISAGQIDIAEPSQVHGAINEGLEDAVFLSIYSAPSLKVITASP
jgi:quercetin dioxygenase-like cupin family protein